MKYFDKYGKELTQEEVNAIVLRSGGKIPDTFRERTNPATGERFAYETRGVSDLDAVQLTPEEQEVCTRMGLSTEKFLAAKRGEPVATKQHSYQPTPAPVPAVSSRAASVELTAEDREICRQLRISEDAMRAARAAERERQ